MCSASVWDPLFCQRSPIFAPLCAIAAPLERFSAWPTPQDYSRLIATPIYTESGAAIRFADADPRAVKEKYEIAIHRYGTVPTRAQKWHDLLNALVWIAFPRTKARINALHYAAEQARTTANRTRAQDVLTLFDEGGLIVASTSNELLELIRGFQWKTLFWQRREAVLRELRFFLFGHALYEKALTPYKGMTAKSVLLHVPPASMQASPDRQRHAVDEAAADWFRDATALRATQSLAPVPILGLPGWDARNTDERYYDDTNYFRGGYTRERKRLTGER